MTQDAPLHSNGHHVRQKANYAPPDAQWSKRRTTDEDLARCFDDAEMGASAPGLRDSAKDPSHSIQPVVVVVTVPKSTRKRSLGWTESERVPTAASEAATEQPAVPLLPGTVDMNDLPPTSHQIWLSDSISKTDEHSTNQAHRPEHDAHVICPSSATHSILRKPIESSRNRSARATISLGEPVGKAKPDWRKNRDVVEKWISRYAEAVACFGVVGTAMAMLQHEAVLDGVQPDSTYINILKALNSLCSFVILIVLYRFCAKCALDCF